MGGSRPPHPGDLIENAIAANGTVLMESIVQILVGFDEICDQMTHALQCHARGLTLL